MSSSLAALFFLSVFSCTVSSYGFPVSPTYSNATDETYIASAALILQSSSIKCTKKHCHVICDTWMGCSSTQINAALSQDLTIKCTYDSACEETVLSDGPSLSLDITCQGNGACTSSSWSANYTNTVRIQCITDLFDSACADATFKAGSASLVNMNCQGEKSCSSTTLYANSAKVVSITANGDNSLFQSTIKALHAGSLNLFCKPSWLYSNNRDYTCWNNNLYVPSAF
eukprot:223777_1